MDDNSDTVRVLDRLPTFQRTPPLAYLFYFALIAWLERRRESVALSQEALSELIGAERSWQKAVHPLTRSGRFLSWDKLQRVIDTLCRPGETITLDDITRPESLTPGTRRLIDQAIAEAAERRAKRGGRS